MNPAASEPKISFVVPLYQTGASLEPLLAEFTALQLSFPWELILVNDGSTDGTGAKVEAMLPDLTFPATFIDLARNYGEHAAVLEGLRHARGRFIVNLDDDLQNPIAEAVRLCEKLESSDAEIVYARYSDKKHHWFRNLGSWLTNRIATWVLDKPRDLYLCSFRAMRRELVARVISYRGPFPYIDGLILDATNRIDTMLVKHQERHAGHSSYTLRKLVRLWLNMFLNFSIRPLRMASLVGLIMCGIGLLFFLIALAESLFTKRQVPGWASLMGGLSLFSGTQLFMLGVAGEYLGRAYLTVSHKPQSHVRKVATSLAGPVQVKESGTLG